MRFYRMDVNFIFKFSRSKKLTNTMFTKLLRFFKEVQRENFDFCKN